MFCSHYTEGEKLDVGGLNEITVLIDRSQTELTEVAYNEWRKGLTGPPHRHGRKEQVFYLLTGEGIIKISDEQFNVRAGSLLYVPAGADHQTIVTSEESIGYLLFNAFADTDKEGHASFAEHIARVEQTRRQQAESQNAEVSAAGIEGSALETKGKCIKDIFSGRKFRSANSETLLLLDRADTHRCEITVVSLPAGGRERFSFADMEQSLFILSGRGAVTVGSETGNVKEGYVAFAARDTQLTIEAGDSGLVCLCLGTVVKRQMYKNFEQMRKSLERNAKYKQQAF